jgi:predicted nucleic acid-binding Zn ribbon protein
MQASATDHRTCSYCEKRLLGRSDQRFCNDTCRNSFNRAKRQALQNTWCEHIPEILKILKNNYAILKTIVPIETYKEYLLADGSLRKSELNIRFYTSTDIDDNGIMWYCVFDRCYRFDNGMDFIKDIPEKGILR